MGRVRSGNPWLAVLSGAAIIVALTIAGPLVPLVVEVAEAQEESSVSLPALRVPTSDPASDYVNDRIEMVTAQAEAKEAEAAAEAAAAPPADTSTDPAAESSGDEAAATETSGETPPSESKKGGKDKGATEEPPADTAGDAAPAEGGEGTTASLSGSDVVVSSVGESGQVDKPGRHGKRRR
jgi:hypothetical protein